MKITFFHIFPSSKRLLGWLPACPNPHMSMKAYISTKKKRLSLSLPLFFSFLFFSFLFFSFLFFSFLFFSFLFFSFLFFSFLFLSFLLFSCSFLFFSFLFFFSFFLFFSFLFSPLPLFFEGLGAHHGSAPDSKIGNLKTLCYLIIWHIGPKNVINSVPYTTFRLYFIDFQLITDSSSKFGVFHR